MMREGPESVLIKSARSLRNDRTPVVVFASTNPQKARQVWESIRNNYREAGLSMGTLYDFQKSDAMLAVRFKYDMMVENVISKFFPKAQVPVGNRREQHRIMN